jgi:transposase-like protein
VRWLVCQLQAVDQSSSTVDCYPSEHRDIGATKRCFRRAMLHHGPPREITLDGYPASHRTVEELKAEGVLPRDIELRSNAYLNIIVEQDHWRVKQRVGPMLGFKRFDHAAIATSGIDLAQKMRKGQCNTPQAPQTVRHLSDPWLAVLVA